VTFFTTQLAKTTLPCISADIYWAKLLLPEIVMICSPSQQLFYTNI